MREIKIKKYNDEKYDYVRVLLAGQTKAGKTYTAGTFPSPFFIDTDGSGRSLRKQDIPFISYSVGDLRDKSVNIYNEIFILLSKLRETECAIYFNEDGVINFEGKGEKYQIKTLVFDSVTMLADFLCYEAMMDSSIGKISRDPFKTKATFDEYGVLQARLLSIFDLVKELPCNVVATAGLRYDKDEISGAMASFPDILGGFRGKIGHRFDVVGFIEEAKDGTHILHTTPVKKFAAGTRDKLPEKIVNPTYKKMFVS